jgi:N-acetylmuramoyl-L-alanine amidase
MPHPLSSNFDHRPEGTIIDTIILHYTDMDTAQDALTRLCDPASKVSSHYLIDDKGVLYQLVEDRYRAWHAGVSSWRGRHNVNHFSIGIELDNPGESYFQKHGQWKPYSQPQMASLITLITTLIQKHPITSITGHENIAPERKKDPGPHFDWGMIASFFSPQMVFS